ncbi:cytochrome b/b6 domain-containing protein [Palleronia sp. KMU-117]|uniref:cytochrome b/b6 domain-containing protein n=1 Tax=Palleronia sp. KMU-117 TaxID=3434108 RepID=UPI003D71BE7C
MQHVKVWDGFVRTFHWSLVAAFGANALLIDDDTKLHQWVGYVVVGLVLARVIWGFSGTGYARFSSFPASLSGSLGQLRDMLTGTKRLHLGHTPLGALMIYNLIVTLLVIGLSGYLMTTDMYWGVEWPEFLHEASVTWAEISVVLHVGAVILESVRTRVNLPRAMVTGYKDVPPTLN